MSANIPRTLYDKIWDQHLVDFQQDGTALIYIDRHIVHEVGTAVAFDGLREANRTVRRPDLTLATTDHSVPTYSRTEISSAYDYFLEPKTRELYDALERNTKHYGLKFFGIKDKRQGIVHIMAPEQGFILPGVTCVCGDSHTSTHGAFGALAFGIGTSEVEHVLATQTLRLRKSKNMRIAVEGKLHGGVTSKDVILHIIGEIGTAGGTGCVIEYTGSVFRNFSMEARMSVCNMSIEAGARAGLVAPDDITINYLKGRPFAPKGGPDWDQAEIYWRKLHSDEGAQFDIDIRINGEDIPPSVTWGTSPQDVVPITGRVPHPDSFTDPHRRKGVERSLEYMGLEPGTLMEDISIDKVFIGSCTNGRIEDLRLVASVIAAAGSGAHVAQGVYAMIVPGSGIVRDQAEAEGLDVIFKRAGFDWREAGCSMCCGLNPDRLKPQERCASTSNRNFEGRQGSGGRTHLLSPSMAAAAALNGKLSDVRKYGVHEGEAPKSSDILVPVAEYQEQPKVKDQETPEEKRTSSTKSPVRATIISKPKFTLLRGIAAPMNTENVNTDVIIPMRFLTGTKRTGLGQYLFYSLRYSPQTGEKTDFVLNREPYDNACMIVCTGDNFGCGSSREAAPWSLKEFGIQCIIAPSFGEIFENNCFKNGLVAIKLPKSQCQILYEAAVACTPLEINLEKQEIHDGHSEDTIKFDIDPFRKFCLLEGLDEIGLSLQKLAAIEIYEGRKRREMGWLEASLVDVPQHQSAAKKGASLDW